MAADALKTLWLLHGVNLDMLGRRARPTTAADPGRARGHVATARGAHGFAVHSFQTNHEGELVEKLHELAATAPTP